jgi:hypothetical protein
MGAAGTWPEDFIYCRVNHLMMIVHPARELGCRLEDRRSTRLLNKLLTSSWCMSVWMLSDMMICKTLNNAASRIGIVSGSHFGENPVDSLWMIVNMTLKHGHARVRDPLRLIMMLPRLDESLGRSLDPYDFSLRGLFVCFERSWRKTGQNMCLGDVKRG